MKVINFSLYNDNPICTKACIGGEKIKNNFFEAKKYLIADDLIYSKLK
jgi:hypothetical protein